MVGISMASPVVARLRSAAVVMGPAFVVAVAYVDPGNFATNMAGGAKHRYLLQWVIVAASGLAMFIQYQSAKLGVVTGRNLPELCR
ncbi:Nramp family divalent metal transporter, partial [Saccharothrix sp. MB29]|nr:Nramp family divalent metal transporter [Saccharothrix sp. MB29]